MEADKRMSLVKSASIRLSAWPKAIRCGAFSREQPVKHPFRLALIAGFTLILLAACAGSPTAGPAQPLSFNPAPWSDGEVSTYDLRSSSGALLGTEVWTWQRGPEGEQWTQSYELNVSGRLDRGQVVMGADLRPISAWRELSGLRYEATYGPDAITIVTDRGRRQEDDEDAQAPGRRPGQRSEPPGAARSAPGCGVRDPIHRRHSDDGSRRDHPAVGDRRRDDHGAGGDLPLLARAHGRRIEQARRLVRPGCAVSPRQVRQPDIRRGI